MGKSSCQRQEQTFATLQKKAYVNSASSLSLSWRPCTARVMIGTRYAWNFSFPTAIASDSKDFVLQVCRPFTLQLVANGVPPEAEFRVTIVDMAGA